MLQITLPHLELSNLAFFVVLGCLCKFYFYYFFVNNIFVKGKQTFTTALITTAGISDDSFTDSMIMLSYQYFYIDAYFKQS